MLNKIILFLLVILIGGINFDVTLANHEFPAFLSTNAFIISSSILGLLFIYVWIRFRLSHPIHRYELALLGWMVLPFLSFGFGIFRVPFSELNPSLSELNGTFDVSLIEHMRILVNGLSIPILIYVYYFFAQAERVVRPMIQFVLIIMGFTIFGEIGYSLLIEWDKYVYVFNNFNDGVRLDITSFTTNTNIYAFNLTMGIYALGFLFVYYKPLRWLYIPLGLSFAFILVFTVSKTSMLSVVVFGMIYLWMMYFYKFHRRPLLLIAMYALSLVIMYSAYQLIFEINHPFFLRIQQLLTDSAEGSLLSRVDIWWQGLQLVIDRNSLFGYGLGLGNDYLAVATAVVQGDLPQGYAIINDRFHNSFVEWLVAFGWLGSLLVFFHHGIYLRRLFKLTKTHELVIPLWALLISFLVHMMFEDRLLFRPDIGGVFFLAIMILPLVQTTKVSPPQHETNLQSTT